MPQMDRYWISNDGLQVTSRLLMTKWGKVKHAAITIYPASVLAMCAVNEDTQTKEKSRR